MDTWDILRNVWFLLIGVLLAGYSVLDGFDLGVGALLPFLAKTEDEKRSLIGAVGPVWDGNEVWLLAGGGALFAAFPAAYATVFSGFYLALMLVLFALILRAVSLEFRAHDAAEEASGRRPSSAAASCPRSSSASPWGTSSPESRSTRRTEFAGILFHPAPATPARLRPARALRLPACTAPPTRPSRPQGPLRERARRTARALAVAFGIAFAPVLRHGLDLSARGAQERSRPGSSPAARLPVARRSSSAARKKGRDGRAFVFSSAAFLGLWGIVGAIHYPNLVRATDPALSLTVANASSSALTLKVMLLIALVGMPLVIGYTIFAYRVFKGKADAGGAGY